MNWSPRPVRVQAPATSANLGPGFDALGLALALYDQVEAGVTGGGLAIEVTGQGAGSATAGEAHLVVRAMRAGFAALGGQPPGIALHCANAIPHGRGLGSSAAAICSGLLAARALVIGGETALPDDALFGLAAELEGHPDNVAACLAGGLTIAWTPRPGALGAPASAPAGAAGPADAGPGPRMLRLPVPAGLRTVLCVPPFPLATEAARRALPAVIPHADAAANAARSALLVAAFSGAAEVLFAATEDFLHQPYRTAVMPQTADLVSRLRHAGLAAVVSGSGPAVLVLSFDSQGPPAAAVDSIGHETGIDWQVIPLDIDRQGGHVRQGGPGVQLPESAREEPSWNQGQGPGAKSRGRVPA
ncbi:MAG TPA: homoserine kinase [Streptosporangiaceae bacterium]